MKQIQLTQGKMAIVDDGDYERLNQWKWCAHKHRATWYAVRNSLTQDAKYAMIFMHREILGFKFGDGIETDHKDGNGLNNRRNNLRPATTAQNHQNARKRTGCSSQYKGVSWDHHAAKWRATIGLEGKMFHLGLFGTEIEAAQAYDKGAQKYFGEFARMNHYGDRQQKAS